MTRMLRTLAVLSATVGLSASASAQDTIVLGVSAPLSGAAASWGIGVDWASQQAAP